MFSRVYKEGIQTLKIKFYLTNQQYHVTIPMAFCTKVIHSCGNHSVRISQIFSDFNHSDGHLNFNNFGICALILN
jgi:hypothetical protein